MSGLLLGKSVGLASDHGAVELRHTARKYLQAQGFIIQDYGTDGHDSVDYPDYADRLAGALASGDIDWGVAMCGTGLGISMALNRHRHVRAALCHNETLARMARAHNDANVIVFGGRMVGGLVMQNCLDVFVKTAYEMGRHQQRIAKFS